MMNEALRKFLLGQGSVEELKQEEVRIRTTAKNLAEESRITDQQLSRQIQHRAFSYSEFQDLSLYDRAGFFEQRVEFTQASMPLLPQVLSPLFGKTIAELALIIHLQHPQRSSNVTFLGLGAGRGYLDYDLIEHVKTVRMQPGYQQEIEAIRDNSHFIVSDRTDKSQSLLTEELKDLKDKYGNQLSIMQLNALDFRLKRKPYGIVYANELLDNLPIEPIIKIDGQIYSVSIVPYSPNEERSMDNYNQEFEKMFKTINGRILTREETRKLVSADKASTVRFLPALLPLGYSHDLREKVEKSTSYSRHIEDDDFNGLYPYQIGLPRVLENIKQSFEHGMVLFIDYPPIASSTHNWHKAVGIVNNHILGQEDLDFQVDFDQITEEGEKQGMETIYLSPQHETMQALERVMRNLTLEDAKRWAKTNQVQGPPAYLPQLFAQSYARYLPWTNYHKIVVMQF